MSAKPVTTDLTKIRQPVRNQRGQGLIEYLIIVALMGVATIAIMRTMGQAVSSKFATITHHLNGDKKTVKARVDKSTYKKKDMGDFFNGAAAGRDDSSSEHAEEAE